MAKATVHSLTKGERALIAETAISHLAALDEDALIALHQRVRRARNKHVQLHRQEVGGQVVAQGSRGTASIPARRSASKAEIFEDALSRVSTALAKSARRSASALRAERLATARGNVAAPTRASRSRAGSSKAPVAVPRSRQVPPIERKSVVGIESLGGQTPGQTRRSLRSRDASYVTDLTEGDGRLSRRTTKWKTSAARPARRRFAVDGGTPCSEPTSSSSDDLTHDRFVISP